MKAYPIDSHVTFDEDGIPEYDRAITSEPLRKLIKSLFKTGIDPTVTANLQVAAGEGMEVVVRPGFAVVDGCMALEEDMRTLVVQASSNMYDRIDTVVLRLDDNDPVRDCDLHIVEGVPSSNPVRPDLTRSGSIYEIGLADIFVGKNSERILTSKIVDTRYENARCGVMSSISEFNTAMLNQQMNAWSAEARAEFEQWINEIKDILDANAAGHLQEEIDSLQSEITKSNQAIKELKDKTSHIDKHQFALKASEATFGSAYVEQISLDQPYTGYTEDSYISDSIYHSGVWIGRQATMTSGDVVGADNISGVGLSIYNCQSHMYTSRKSEDMIFAVGLPDSRLTRFNKVDLATHLIDEQIRRNHQAGLAGILDDVDTDVTIHLDCYATYLLTCTAHNISDKKVYGATARLVIVGGDDKIVNVDGELVNAYGSLAPTLLSLSQTQNAPCTITAKVNNMLELVNPSAARLVRYSLIRIM
ncbi:hypothetical protein SAMN04487830_14816 [Pseudobutyrivibrio sp. OR37]|uniref:hypothetical protein n=1 Tax=Pseudobutyrivibrio sp. OR37 TaxID=1798186 RepID=UPI0008EF7A5C|nr:hypothetical protein [Pseudobutyrivibrio sp. OR37]SFI36004.1 hypothetical protein SAMN04487830_14816 [Pseudobutyrivibrio sp. OR37]